MPRESIMADRGYVTSEAVELDIPAAPLPARIGGALIDAFVIFCATVAGLFLWAQIGGDFDPAAQSALNLILYITTVVVLPTVLETLTKGRSLGKWATGLRVVRDDAGPISMRHALTRALAAPFEMYFTLGVPAVIASATNRKGKRFGDLAAGTYVVRVRQRTAIQRPSKRRHTFRRGPRARTLLPCRSAWQSLFAPCWQARHPSAPASAINWPCR
ncbi:RDD family protein [Ornithinimicrobium sp. INDO-MA30-4]|uniref:RDD family protein n=1 Tax=Ornithinimicrobium sp. INDO-MA30-4 TaxID=2908651 RepID=UPI001F468B5F|nr:RDD family protein [Ornithinimicrobium sp. INDO-MA30-4]UJH71461.1 RDD family protein [Ornithinimicrobium sp. INDO-MA30-4]